MSRYTARRDMNSASDLAPELKGLVLRRSSDDTDADSLLDAVKTLCAEILSAKGTDRCRQRIERAQGKLLESCSCCETGHINTSQSVIRRLHDHTSNGCDGKLQSHGRAHGEC